MGASLEILKIISNVFVAFSTVTKYSMSEQTAKFTNYKEKQIADRLKFLQVPRERLIKQPINNRPWTLNRAEEVSTDSAENVSVKAEPEVVPFRTLEPDEKEMKFFVGERVDLRQHRERSGEEFKCDKCPKVFKTYAGFYKHGL